ncbi:MAG: type VI secretion system lipoprotein TssJ [Colwellia sp.]|nr:type VI secretion system lipoprotein TssJ [Colwellia sp.]
MTDRLHSFVNTTLLLLLALSMSACSVFSSTEPEPVELKMILQASDNINPSDVSNANPVVVNLYQLKSIDAFQSAQILDLFEKDISVLADDLVKRQTLASVLPLEKRVTTLAVAQGTKFLAVFVQFSNYSQAKTRAWIEIKDVEDIEHVTISIDSLTVNFESVKEDSFWPW